MTLEELERLAREATPGLWYMEKSAGSLAAVTTKESYVASTHSGADDRPATSDRRNAAHIAAWSPATVLTWLAFARAWDAYSADMLREDFDKVVAARRALEEG